MESISMSQNLNYNVDKRVLPELLVEDKVVSEIIIELPPNQKKQSYKKNSPKYKEFCHLFCTKFTETLGKICGMSYDDVQQLFEKRIKKICIRGSDNYYDPATKIVSLSYDIAYSNSFVHCFIHEALHGISAVNKRRNIFRTLFNTSDFKLEEGMTDFYTCCMLKTENKINSPYSCFAGYRMQATAISLLNKLLDPKQMLNFYLNDDKTFVHRLNGFDHKAYSKIKKILNNTKRAIASRGFNKANMEALDYFYSLLKSNKLVSVFTIDDFKKNVDALLEIYEQELNLLSEEMYINNRKLKNMDNRENKIEYEKEYIKKLGYTFFNVFKNIVVEQWNLLNINDETLFCQIIMEKISQKYPYVYPAIAYSNVFPNFAFENIEKELPEHSSSNSIVSEKKLNKTVIPLENKQYHDNDFNNQYSNEGRTR